MEILFENADLKKLCENQKNMVRQLGQVCARKLRGRLADLNAAEMLADLTVGHPHPLTGDRAGQFAIDLHKGCRLVFKSNDPVPLTSDGVTDWRSVTDIIIIFIGDYHE